MFDIGFSELLLIFILALIVLGPERLPRVARQIGSWVGRARGMARQLQEQLQGEVDAAPRAAPAGEVSKPAAPAGRGHSSP